MSKHETDTVTKQTTGAMSTHETGTVTKQTTGAVSKHETGTMNKQTTGAVSKHETGTVTKQTTVLYSSWRLLLRGGRLLHLREHISLRCALGGGRCVPEPARL